jgi:hypothetical protein
VNAPITGACGFDPALGAAPSLVTERRTHDGGAVVVYTDITELKQRQRELEKGADQQDGPQRCARHRRRPMVNSLFRVWKRHGLSGSPERFVMAEKVDGSKNLVDRQHF